jgi:hypothetical protein
MLAATWAHFELWNLKKKEESSLLFPYKKNRGISIYTIKAYDDDGSDDKGEKDGWEQNS